MSFFLYLMQFLTILTVRVEWIHDVLIIPLYGDIDTVKHQPEARLYVDGFWVVGARVIYERNGVEWTYLSTVNTAHVRNYTIKYRAYFPDYNLYDVHPITFSVVDQMPPTIVKVDEMTVAVGDKMPDLKQAIVVVDNYYAKEQLSIIVDTSGVNLSRVGDYQIIYRISDPSGNLVTQQAIFHVVDYMPPSITLIKPIVVSVFGSWQWQSFMTVKDNVDTVLQVEINDQHVTYDTIGTYVIDVTVSDRSGNRTTEQMTLDVKDITAPTLQLRTKPPIINVYTMIDRQLLESFVIAIYDNYDDLDISDVIITHDIDTHIIGSYKITYRIIDHSGNETNMVLNASVADLISPIIELIQPLVVDVYTAEPFWITFFQYSDNFTATAKLTTKLSTTVKLNVIGQYPLTLDVTDGAGNVSTYRGYIHVVDRLSPSLIQKSDVIITDFQRKPLEYYFQATDQYDAPDKITITIDDETVDYETIGIYQAWCYATDRSGNQTSLSFDLVIIDPQEPRLTLKKYTVIKEWGETSYDFYQLIDEVSDNYDTLTKSDVIVTHTIDWTQLGRYDVLFYVMDQSKNKTSANLVFVIDDRQSPTLSFDDLIIREGDILDLWEGVHMSDNHHIHQTYVFPNRLETTQPGHYTLTYVVMDERGNYVIKDRSITIEPNPHSYTLVSFLPMGFVFLIGGAILYILYKKG